MKRHPSLIPLSKDHHQALQLAEGLKPGGADGLQKALPEDLPERAAHVARLFTEVLEPHFAREERVIVPACRGRRADLDEAVDRVLRDHTELRSLVGRIREGHDLETALPDFGRALADHVRLEEREWFVLIEQTMSAAELEALAGKLA